MIVGHYNYCSAWQLAISKPGGRLSGLAVSSSSSALLAIDDDDDEMSSVELSEACVTVRPSEAQHSKR